MKSFNLIQAFNELEPADKIRTIGAGAAGVGATVVGGNQIWATRVNWHTARIKRLLEHQKALTTNQITPRQFLTLEARDGARPKQLEEDLRAWSGKWKGVDFGDCSQFSVVETKHEGWNTPSCYDLKLKPTESPSKELGLRGGATAKGLEPETVVVGRENPSIEALEHWSMRPSLSQGSLLHPISNIAENKEENWETFSVTLPETPFLQTFVGSYVTSFAFVGVGCALWAGLCHLFQHHYNKRQVRNDKHQVSVTCQSTDPIVRSAKASTALLRILVAYHDRQITKAAAISLLRDYHSKTVEEALALLEEPQSPIFRAP